MHRRLIAAACVAAAWLAGAYGASVSPGEARLAVENWLAEGDALGSELGTVAGDAAEYSGEGGEGAFYVVPLAKADGTPGGFVVTSAETRISPVIAFSGEGEFTASDASPLWVLLSRDVARAAGDVAALDGSAVRPAPLAAANGPSASRAIGATNEERWARLTSRRAAEKTASQYATAAAPSDLRVGVLVSSRWNQEADAYGSRCYNLYTPNNYPCGCVATALAQLLYYWKRPSGAVETQGDYGYTVNGTAYSTPAGTVLGPWNWGSMSDRPSTSAQREAVGRLCADMGLLVCMDYGPRSSGTAPSVVDRRLSAELGFVSKQLYFDNNNIDMGQLKKCVIPSLEAGFPVFLGIAEGTSGHAVLGDGYGYSDGDFYMHLNMGWGGTGDAWYAPPYVNAAGQTFSSFHTLIYNIYPEGIAWGTIFTGRVFDASGAALAGQSVTARHVESGETFSATTKPNGTFVFVLPGNGAYEISATKDGLAGSIGVVSDYCISCDTAQGGKVVYLDDGGVGWSNSRGCRNESKNAYGLDFALTQAEPSVLLPILTPVSPLVDGTTTFLTRRFTFTLGCDTDGATVRYTLDGSDPTEGSPVYDGAVEIECAVGETRTVKARAFRDGYRPSDVLSRSFTRQEPERWIDERPETHEGTGWWWPERTDFAGDGLLHFAGDYYYHPNRQSYERVATIDSTMVFDAPDESDSLRPGDDAKAAVRIGPNGGFQVFTRLSDGRKVWQDVAAEGVAAEAGRAYTIRFRLDCVSRAYTVAIVLDGGGEKQLKSPGGSTRFRFANGAAGCVAEITYEGAGKVGSILGECADGVIESPSTFNFILR